MGLKAVTFAAAGGAYTCDQADDQSGKYVKAEDAENLAQLLGKLVWTVHYGKAFDASNVATEAEQLLARVKA